MKLYFGPSVVRFSRGIRSLRREITMGCSRMNRFTAVVVAGSLFFSSTGAIAATSAAPAPQVNPWAALTAMSGGAPAAALCGAATVAAAAQAAAGCVLPVTDAPVPVASAPPAPIPVPPVEPTGMGLAFDPLLLALGALAAGALIYFLVRNNDDDDEVVSPN
jgi:hypothetical protein